MKSVCVIILLRKINKHWAYLIRKGEHKWETIINHKKVGIANNKRQEILTQMTFLKIMKGRKTMVNLKNYYDLGCGKITKENETILRNLVTRRIKELILNEYEAQEKLISEKKANVISSSNPDGDINYVRGKGRPYIYLYPEKMGMSKSSYLQVIKLLEKDGKVKLNPDNEYQFKEV